MELRDVMSLVGQPEYWPLMIGGLLFVLVLVLYRRVGKSAGATSRDLAALHDAVEQLTERFNRLSVGGFPAVPDARPESPCGDDIAPLSATGAVAGMAVGAVMAESEEVLGEPLTDSGPEELLAEKEPESLGEEEPVGGFSFDAATDEEDATLAAAAEAPGLEEGMANDEPESLGEEEPIGGFSFDAATDEGDEAALTAESAEPGPDELLADEEPTALGEEEPAGDFFFDATGEEDEAGLTEGASELKQEEAAAPESAAAAASEALGENLAADDFAFEAAADEKDEAVRTTAPAEPAMSEVFTDDAGNAQPETESREDQAGMSGSMSDELPDTQEQVEETLGAGEQQETAPAVAESGPATPMEEEVAPPDQQQSPELVVLPGNPQRPEVALARCGQCGRKIAYPKRLSGKRVRCPSCKSGYVLP